MTGRLCLITALLAQAMSFGCEEPELPIGPPRCEPEHEHEVDRRLKLGFKALLMGEADRARGYFQAVLGEEPQHPEAQLGLRLLKGRQAIEPGAPDDSDTPAPDGAGASGAASAQATPARIEVAGQWLAVPLPVDASRWRFEELRSLARLRKERVGTGQVFTSFRARAPRGEPIAPTDSAALFELLDLVVLHDSHTLTARDAVVDLEARGASTHFIIDWDGAVYQLLDLVWEANHCQITAIDVRSVSIDLVNPVELGQKPGLPDSAEARGLHRPLSEFVRVQGEEVQAWGYTEAQLASLEALVRALGKVLPSLPMRVPGGGAIVPRAVLEATEGVRGITGHLHVSRLATDPGPGFPWELFGRAIRAP